MAGLATATLDAFEAGYSLPGKLRAKAAAVKQYGAAAEDPGLFSALGQEQRAGNADVRAERTADRADKAETRLGAANTRQQQVHESRQGDDEIARKKTATIGVMQGIITARDSGGDVGEAFDQQKELLEQLGVDPGDFDEMRQSIIDDPKLLDQYLASLQGQSGKSAARQTDKQRALTILNNPNASEADTKWANTVVDGKMGAKDKAKMSGALVRAKKDIEMRLDILEDPETEQAARAIFATPSPGKLLGSGGFGNLMDPIWGSSAANYLSNFEALADGDIRSAAFETLKGGGQITEKESEFAANAISRLTRAVSYEEYRRELVRLRTYLNDLTDAAERRINGEDVPEVVPASNPDEVEVYIGFVDPDGNTFKGGAFDDQANWEMAE